MEGRTKSIIKYGALTILAISFPAFAHKNHHKDSAKVKETAENTSLKAALEKANEGYVRNVRPIFEKKCFDCHSSRTTYPWYHKVPGIKQWMQKDISEARKHLDMDGDFPFKSHATPIEDLEAISEAVTNEEMPPLRYRIMHSGSELTKEESEKVQQWVRDANILLKEAK